MKNVYRLFSSAVIHELLDDEVIIAHLDSGVYYSLRGSAVPVWQLLMAEYSLEYISTCVTEKYPSVSQDFSVQLNFFVDQLCKEGLLASDASEMSPKNQISHWVWPLEWKEPSLEKYEEMKNLLMLDPIHEVDEQGWPHQSTQR